MELVQNTLAKKFTTCSVAIILGCANALADSKQSTLEETIVSAQKREERAQNVPISMSIISLEDLRELNLFSLAETAGLTPGVSLSSGLQSGSLRIRGVGPGAFSVNAPQSVALFVDQFAQVHPGTVMGAMLDVKRVEVLRGPQGTLYGQNAPVGVYNISTRNPDPHKLSGHIQASYSLYDGDNDRATQDVRGAINIPLVRQRVGWRLSGLYRDADGFITMEHPEATRAAIGGREAWAARSRLLWEPTASIQLNWTLNIQDITDFPVSGNLEGQVPGTGGKNVLPAMYTRFHNREYWEATGNRVQGEVRDSSFHGVYDAGWAQFDALALYQKYSTVAAENRQPFEGDADTFFLDLNSELVTLELRASHTGESIDYVAGLYYYDKSVGVDADFLLGNFSVAATGREATETLSAFGNVGLHLSDRWGVSLGLRIDNSDVSAAYDNAVGDLLNARLAEDQDYQHLSWSSKLLWSPSDDFTGYLALDNAFKPGGYNPLVSLGAAARGRFPDIASVADENIRFREETTKAFEIGLKGAAMEGALRYTAAVYFQYFDDYQLVHQGSNPVLQPLGDVFSNSITNAEGVVATGAEFSFKYQIGRHWTINQRTAYIDADIDKWSKRFCQDQEGLDNRGQAVSVYCPVSNQPLNNLSKWSANTRLRYKQRWGGWQWLVTMSWTWESAVDSTHVTSEFRESKHRVSASIGARSRITGWGLRLWAKNLTNEDFNQDPGIQRNGDFTQPDALRGAYSRGRELGITVGYRFR